MQHHDCSEVDPYGVVDMTCMLAVKYGQPTPEQLATVSSIRVQDLKHGSGGCGNCVFCHSHRPKQQLLVCKAFSKAWGKRKPDHKQMKELLQQKTQSCLQRSLAFAFAAGKQAMVSAEGDITYMWYPEHLGSVDGEYFRATALAYDPVTVAHYFTHHRVSSDGQLADDQKEVPADWWVQMFREGELLKPSPM